MKREEMYKEGKMGRGMMKKEGSAKSSGQMKKSIDKVNHHMEKAKHHIEKAHHHMAKKK